MWIHFMTGDLGESQGRIVDTYAEKRYFSA